MEFEYFFFFGCNVGFWNLDRVCVKMWEKFEEKKKKIKFDYLKLFIMD